MISLPTNIPAPRKIPGFSSRPGIKESEGLQLLGVANRAGRFPWVGTPRRLGLDHGTRSLYGKSIDSEHDRVDSPKHPTLTFSRSVYGIKDDGTCGEAFLQCVSITLRRSDTQVTLATRDGAMRVVAVPSSHVAIFVVTTFVW